MTLETGLVGCVAVHIWPGSYWRLARESNRPVCTPTHISASEYVEVIDLTTPTEDTTRDLSAAAHIAATFFHGLCDATRIEIVSLLLDEGEMSVGDLVGRLDVSQGRVSTHLACLRTCGFVVSRREGRFVYYRVADPRVKDLLRSAQEIILENAEQILTCNIVN